MAAFERFLFYCVQTFSSLIGRRLHLLVRFLGGVLSSCSRSVRASTRLCEGRRSGSTPGENTFQLNYGAGARRQGDCLQSSFKWIGLRAPIGMDAGLFVRLCVDVTISICCKLVSPYPAFASIRIVSPYHWKIFIAVMTAFVSRFDAHPVRTGTCA